MGPGAWCRGSCVQTGWLTELAQHLAGGVPLADSNVSVVNVGHPGNTFGSYVHCTEHLIPRTGDLYILDAATIHAAVNDVEVIVRWVLELPQRPAVLLLHLYDFCGSRGGGKTNEELRKACYKPRMQVGRFVQQSEMERNLDDLGAYYGLPAVSIRRAFFQQAVMAGPVKNRPATTNLPATEHLFAPSSITWDGLHPSRGGEYTRLIAALLVSFTIDLKTLYRDAPPAAGDPLPCLPLYKQVRQHSQEEHCFAATDDEAYKGYHSGFLQLAPADGTAGFRFTQFDTALQWDDGRGCSSVKQVSIK